MFRPPQLREQPDALATPRAIRGQTEPLPDDAIDLFAEQQLGESQLLIGGQRLRRFVTDAEQSAARERFLVLLDLVLHVELVLVAERALGMMRRHYAAGENTGS